MPNTKIIATSIVAAGLLLAAGAPAQQPPAANSPSNSPAAAQSSAAPKSTQTPAAKPGASSTAKKPAAAPLTLTTQTQKLSYALGMGLGKNLKRDSVDVDPAILLRGLKDALAGNKLLLTDDESKAAITALQTDLRNKEIAKAKAEAVANKAKGDAFLAENKTKEGVVTLPSGLQYKIITAGDGPKPAADDTVNCDYRGTLIDGTEFDSSYKRGKPLTIQVNRVIKGWTEAMQLMPVGSKWQLFIPSDLGYGPQGAPGSPIGPNSVLVFEVELHSIEPKQAKEPPSMAPKQPQADQKAQPQAQQPQQPKDQAAPATQAAPTQTPPPQPKP